MMRYITKHQNANVVSCNHSAISWHMLKYILLFCNSLVLLIYSVPFLMSQDTANLDELFLDDSFTDDSNILLQEDDTPDSNIGTHLSKKAASIDMNMSIIEKFTYRGQTDRTTINRDRLLYISPIVNTLRLEHYLQYQNAERWFGFTMDYRLYFLLEDREKTSKTTGWDLDTYFNYELNELYMRAMLWDQKIGIYAGKLLFGSGSSFLINPSNPLTRRYGTDIAWAKNTTVSSFSTKNPPSPSPKEEGSGEFIGSWMGQVVLTLPSTTMLFAYLPKLETGFYEFDRPNHSFLTSLKSTYWESFIPTIVTFYDGNIFLGMDASIGIGDTVTLQFESGMSFENELMNITQDGKMFSPPSSYLAYTLDAVSDKGMYIEGVAGITYTPVYESKSLFSILFEVYYNGKGLYNDAWNTYINMVKDIHNVYDKLYNIPPDSRLRAMAAPYKGILGKNLSYYNSLRVRPLYMLLRIYRDDIFENIWTQQINVSTGIVYSPFDTTFAWNAEIEWTNRDLLTIGTELQSFFGRENGAFTELTSNTLISIYTELHF